MTNTIVGWTVPRAMAGAMLGIAVVAAGLTADAEGASRMLSREQARRLGLQRAWFSQVQLDRAQNHVERAVLTRDELTVLTSGGVVQEFNALTGQSRWVAPIGNPLYPSLGPATSDKHVAVVNGSTLYVLDVSDGRPVIIRRLGGAPGASPSLSKKYIFVPLTTGRVEGYPLDQPKRTPWYYQSFGRTMVPPLATAASVVWSTDRGYVYVGRSEEPGVRFRLETASDIVAAPAAGNGSIFSATLRGELFAIDESTGAQQWKFATGYPITRAPAAVGDHVFVTSAEPALLCVDAKTGVEKWAVPHVTEFAAASRSRVYALDDLNELVVLDAATGAVLDRMPTDGRTMALVNDQTDRLYLVSDDGLVQCFHEIGVDKPLYHKPATTEQPKDGEQPAPPGGSPAAEPVTDGTAPAGAPAAGQDPFAPPAGGASVRPAEPRPAGGGAGDG